MAVSNVGSATGVIALFPSLVSVMMRETVGRESATSHTATIVAKLVQVQTGYTVLNCNRVVTSGVPSNQHSGEDLRGLAGLA